ncbi:MAG: endonuclease III domain-containing protein [Nitrospinaceae bacterium]|jgi:endonuclease-3|tara:strand:+ start:242 stop:895 length:654 start_codon:yes stop_codon:yes gene_type:complete
MNPSDISISLKHLRKSIKTWPIPVVTAISSKRNPFMVLVSCILSLRTRDMVTASASDRLFVLACTPEDFVNLEPEQVEKAIYPVAFFRNKTVTLFNLCRVLIDEYDGKVPELLDELLQIKGVGRKTANLTITLGYGNLGICVDVHVHRISNRWGYVETKSPDETEIALRKMLPKRYWKEFNNLLVSFGQNICKPTSPYCSKCCIEKYCSQTGVISSR